MENETSSSIVTPEPPQSTRLVPWYDEAWFKEWLRLARNEK